MSKIFHILKKDEWLTAKDKGEYRPLSLNNEGFIHCSKADQILSVANNFYRNQNDLLLLRINSIKLISELKVEAPLEAPMSDILFPHIFGCLNIDAVEAVLVFNCQKDGFFSLPKDLI